MLITDRERLRDDIAGWAGRYGRERSSLLPILQEIQKKYRRVSDHAMQIVADLLGIHPIEVYGVASFYSFLSLTRQGKYVIRLCRTISCDMAGKESVAQQLRNDLGIGFGQTTPDGMFTLEWANCLGMCDQGPAMLVNDKVYTQVTPQQVNDIIEQCRRAVSVFATHNKEH
ncbi:MAG: NADH-quinone oxidoreductase subunit NuoE [Planctomycetes bacterium]|nr:NADH-quinone oxidoreductase subunit NuoE [Planctomycetota bacterium]